MVFKPINLARQSFVKTFTHGYAQSLVAASQSSSASQNTSFHTFGNNVVNFFARHQQTQQQLQQQQQQTQHAHNIAHPSGAGARASQHDGSGTEGGLAAYYAAWQKHQKSEDKEWHQFEFAKRIGWKAPTTIPENSSRAKEQPSQEQPRRAGLTRSYTTSAVDDIKEAGGLVDASTLVASPQPLSTKEDDLVLQSTAPQDVSPPAAETETHSSVASPTEGQSSIRSLEATSVVSETDAYTQQLVSLAEEQRYGEVPAVFEQMLVAGAQPNASMYNALLLAAINLPRGKHQVVPKALDVYSDMLRRRVFPDTSTYAILTELLAARALDVVAMKEELLQKRARFGGMDERGSFLFGSDEAEFKILTEDDSLSLAIKLFDTSAAVTTEHVYPSETYRLLICACAETGRISDMVRIYAAMESHGVVPPSAIFAPMIQAFAATGDLCSSVECYDEYKTLAIAHDKGEKHIVRKDEDVYASVVKAYSICGRTEGGLKFLGKLEDLLQDSDHMTKIRDTVALQALLPQWLGENRHADALAHAMEKMSVESRPSALATICCDAADKTMVNVAAEAYASLVQSADASMINRPLEAMLAMNVRLGNVQAASDIWSTFASMKPYVSLVEPTTMYVLSLIGSGNADSGLREGRATFARVRASAGTKSEAVEHIDEAIEVISSFLLRTNPIPSASAAVELVTIMVENGSLVAPVAERLLAGLGPESISQMSLDSVNILTQVQAGLLASGSPMDIAHGARFAHLCEIMLSASQPMAKMTSRLVEQAAEKLGRADLISRLQAHGSVTTSLPSPAFTPFHALAPPTPVFEDAHDPYGASTDYKGSALIADELEKSYGKHSAHLSEALAKFRNIRRAGRHPRYVTYAKLITAAAKEDHLSLAQEIVAMAKQDVPLVPNSRIVRHGWVTILDAMVGACLTVGKRDLADRFHNDLLGLGAAPSANTFGLYITTLKESAKTFDEATEAVKIFLRAKSEGVEPSSFLYNALIGKLGKARRIDDCLYYFAEMRGLGIRPTSVTYGTVVNALCRVSDDRFAEELFEEMENMPNYKPRPAPYNSLMQYFLTTKRDRSKVLAYYERMRRSGISPTMHTYKLLVDAHASLSPADLPAAEAVLKEMRDAGCEPEPVHYAALVHAKGCVLHDMAGARALFDSVTAESHVAPSAALYQALFEGYVSNHEVAATEPLVARMRVPLTPYIANTLIHGWATAGHMSKARGIYDALGREKREPSTYEAMTRAYLAADEHGAAMQVVGEALRRGYPAAVANKICELVSGGQRAAA